MKPSTIILIKIIEENKYIILKRVDTSYLCVMKSHTIKIELWMFHLSIGPLYI